MQSHVLLVLQVDHCPCRLLTPLRMFTKKLPLPSWSLSKKIMVGTIFCGSMSYNAFKNVIAADYFVKKESLKSADNKIVTLPLEMHEFADEVRKELRLKAENKEKIKFFCSKGLDITHIGNLNLIGLTRIGIPYTFQFDKVEDVDPNVVGSLIGANKFRQEDWFKTENGKKLVASLVLTESGRKFAIARGILASDSEMVIYRDFIAFFNVFLSILSYEFLQPRTATFIGKWPSIVLVASMMAVIYVSCFTVIMEFASQSCIKMDDFRTLQYSTEDYKKGAPEYYEKLIERNKSLRGLLIDGPERFDSDGNPISWYQINFSSLKDRLDNCKKIIDTWKEETGII